MEEQVENSNSGDKHAILFFIASLSLIPISLLSLYGGIIPNPDYAPSSLFVYFWLLILPMPFIGYIMPSVLFIAWNWYLLKGRKKIPIRTTIAFFLLLALNVRIISGTWSFSIDYHGIEWTHWVVRVNAISMLAVIACWIYAVKRKTSLSNLVFSWAMFAWLSWCAFPYMGEYM